MIRREPVGPAVTRRQVVAALVAAPAMAQAPTPPVSTVPPEGVPSAVPAPANAQARRQKAEDGIRKASEALRNVKVPLDLEPSFAFSALSAP